ncbi:MAG TPA: SURF1 family protein, partial [Gemmatimonadales bacterium]|nr:SURF1 family protein [Gemmatimonadales bacterium]
MALRSRSVLVAGFLLVAAVCARLGIWQVHRLRERRAANTLAQAGRAAPAVQVDSFGLDSSLINRRVVVRGKYDHDHDVVLRGRGYSGVPGVEIVSPLLQQSGMAVLVNRGFVPTPDAVTVDRSTVEEPGPVTVQGIALPFDSAGGAPLRRGNDTTWARLDRRAISQWVPYRIEPLYVRQMPDSTLPRFPRRLDPPPLDDGPHLSYAMQWFAFSIIALV